MLLTDPEAARLLHAVACTSDGDVGCAAFLHRTAALLEEGVRAAPEERTALELHQRLCPCCAEEGAALTAALASDAANGR